MIFQERKVETGYSYDVEDLFGTIHIDSSEKLTPDTLDGVVLLLLGENATAAEISGEVKHGENILTYKFIKRPMWSDDEPEETTCKNSPSSTSETEKGSMLKAGKNFLLKSASILNWLRRFAAAFREAWKKSSNK